MRQTAVYLRKDQHAALKQMAARFGRTEADLLREGVDLVLARHGAPLGSCEMPTGSAGHRLADRTDEFLDGFGTDR